MDATLGRPETSRPTQARWHWRWSLPTILVALVLANMLLALALFALRAPWVSRSREVEVPTLPVQIGDLQQRIAEGRSGEPYVLDLDDGALTAAANYYAATARDVPFTRIQVHVVGNRLTLDAVTANLAVPVPVQALVALSAVDGIPQARVEDVRIAGSGLPGFARDQILREANASLDLSRYALPLTVDTIDTTPGRLVLRGRLR
jgi:DUF2993 family protein